MADSNANRGRPLYYYRGELQYEWNPEHKAALWAQTLPCEWGIVGEETARIRNMWTDLYGPTFFPQATAEMPNA